MQFTLYSSNLIQIALLPCENRADNHIIIITYVDNIHAHNEHSKPARS